MAEYFGSDRAALVADRVKASPIAKRKNLRTEVLVIPLFTVATHNSGGIFAANLREVNCLLKAVFVSGSTGLISVGAPYYANASIPSRTSPDTAYGGSGYADTVDPCPAGSTRVGDLRDHAVRLNRRNCHCPC